MCHDLMTHARKTHTREFLAKLIMELWIFRTHFLPCIRSLRIGINCHEIKFYTVQVFLLKGETENRCNINQGM